MSLKKNKVKFNICNVHYALQSLAEDGTVTFGTPVAMPGAVSLSLDANGEPSNFYADGYAYYTISNNMGYDGDLELAMVPESFRTDVLKEELDSNQVLVENANVETANFALLFEFDGDVKKIRHVLYNCAASRPSIESQTNEDEIEVKTETLALKATPMANGYVKAKTGDSTTDAVYQKWYEAVYLPTSAEAVPEVQSLASAAKTVSTNTTTTAKTTTAAKEV
jgi:phi13 family phage major tail protein